MQKKQALVRLVVLFAVFLSVPSEASPNPKSSPSLQSKPRIKPATSVPAGIEKKIDSASVRKYYLDGEFEQSIVILETGLKEIHTLRHNDSVFIFKHLGVMYAARYETREKGKFYMHQLLMTEPTAKIMDMYASDMIYMIFKNIQDEFETNRVRLDNAEQLVMGNNQKSPSPKNDSTHGDTIPDRQSKLDASGGNAVYWWMGGIALVAGIGGGYYLYSQQSETSAKDTEIVAR